MLKFKNLILSIINEGPAVAVAPATGTSTTPAAPSTSTAPVTAPSSGQPLSLRDLFFTPLSNTTSGTPNPPTNITQAIKDLETPYNNAYGPSSAPSADDLIKIFNIWKKCWSRTSASQFFEYGQYMPYIEFMAQVAHLAGNVTNVDARFETELIQPAAFMAAITTFKAALVNKPTANPIDFPVSTAEGQYIATQLKKHIQTNFVGQITLDKYAGKSIKDAIFYILEARKKARLATLSIGTVPNQGKEVLQILLKPDNFAGGNYAFSNKVSSDKIYTRAIHTELLGIGLSARRLFDAECTRLFEKDPTGKGFIDPGPEMGDSAYEVFLNNGSLDGQNCFAFADDGGGTVSATDVGTGGYIVGNLKAISSKNEAAKDLYDKLTELANYVREGEIVDWLAVIGGATKIAGGLSMGAPTVGGKR